MFNWQQQTGPAGPGQQHPTVPYGQQTVVQQPTHTGYDPRVGHRTDGYRGYGTDNLPPNQQNGQQQTIPGQNGQPQVMGYVPQQPQQHPQEQQGGYGQQPQGGYQQPPQVQYPGGYQPMGQYPGQVPQQQGGQTIQMSDETILDGPGVPPELRGRRWGAVRQAYTQLVTDAVRGRQQLQPQRQQPQGGYPQTGGYPQPQGQQSGQQGQQGQPVNERSFYERPISTMQETLRGIVREELAPIQSRTRQESLREIEEQVARSTPDYQQLAPLVHQRLQPLMQANPDALTNENIWRDAVRLVRGELMERGQYSQQPQGQNPQQGYGQPGGSSYGGAYTGGYNGYQPARPTPMGGYQMPVNQFFTEGPTPPPMNPQGTLTPTQQWYAEKMSMQPQEYMAWLNGVQPQQQVQQQTFPAYGGNF